VPHKLRLVPVRNERMLRLLQQLLNGQNQFASGGLLLMIIGGIGVFLRQLPLRCWWWMVGQSTMTITVKDDDIAFHWVKEWFLEQEFLKRVRRVDLDTTLRGQELAMIPAPGRHWFMYRGRPLWVWFYRSDNTKERTQRRMEALTFSTVGRDRAFVKAFVADVVACHQRKLRIASHLFVYDEGWTMVDAYSSRLLESVILKPGEKEHLVQDIERFRSSRNRYRQLGVPYHRGYLLYGPPGTGKTSLVSALAAKSGMSIYAVNLTEFTDRSLRSAINDVPENSVVLLEDIDCMRTGNRRTSETEAAKQQGQGAGGEKREAGQFGVTLPGLLNVLDGFHAPENVLFVMTTNRIEVLDPALLRPGRIDYKLYMGPAAKSQKLELYRRFFPLATEAEARDFAEQHHAETMAQFQGLLLALETDTASTSEVCSNNSQDDSSSEEPVLEEIPA
jgi:mitochondrial chaperone BCS1